MLLEQDLIEARPRQGQYRRSARGPLGTFLAASAVAMLLQFAFLGFLSLPKRQVIQENAVEPYDDIWEARTELTEGRHYDAAVAWGEQALVERGPDAGAYAVMGEGYLKMGKIDEARHSLYLATISPGDDKDRRRARDLLESLFDR